MNFIPCALHLMPCATMLLDSDWRTITLNSLSPSAFLNEKYHKTLHQLCHKLEIQLVHGV